MTDTDAPTPTKPTKRGRRAAEAYLIQTPSHEDSKTSWVDVNTGDDNITDTASAMKYLRDRKLQGTFRIIAVKRTVTSKVEQVEKLTIE